MQEKLETLIRMTVTGLGYELWGYEYRSYSESALLRVFIESEDGISVDDCGKVSLQLGAALDVEDIIPVAYVLEVSSPGLDRVLFTLEQYQRYIGEALKVRTRMPIESRRNFVGVLQSVDEQEGSLVIQTTDQAERSHYTIPFDVIDRGRLIYTIQKTPKKPNKGKRSGVSS